MCKVVVVIPVYKEQLKPSERASLERVRKVLGSYDICFMAPEKMRNFFERRGLKAEFWPDSCFENVRAYSHLLLTEEFYSRFMGYEYMLLYQLDAFVFSDRLQEFYRMGYDYIGAPMPHWTGWKYTKVGNGGFSLRKISSCLHVVSRKEEIYERTGRGAECEWAEDKFFGLCGCYEDICFSTTDTKTALRFAIEYDVMRAYENLSKDNLPFGCHAWPKARYWRIWEPFLKELVPNWEEIRDRELSLLPEETYIEVRRKALVRFLLKRFCRNNESVLCDAVVDGVIPAAAEYMLWGSGKIGRDALALLEIYPRKIRCIIDKNPAVNELEGIKVMRPEEALKDGTDCRIIVSVTKHQYVAEITEHLSQLGLKKGEDYILYNDLMEAVVKSYWLESVHKWGR